MFILRAYKTAIFIWTSCFCSGLSGQSADSLGAANSFQRAEQLYEASLYDSVPYYYSEALRYYRESGNPGMAIRCLLGLADTYRIGEDYSKTDELIHEAEAILKKTPGKDSVLQAESWFVQGKLAFNRGEYDKAIEYLTESNKYFDSSLSETGRLIRVLNFLGIVYSRQGNLEQAEIMFTELYGLIIESERSPCIEESWYYSNMNNINRRKGNFQGVIENTIRSIEIKKELYGEDYPDLGDSYYEMAINYSSIGELNSAIAYLDTAKFYLDQYFPDEIYRQVRLYILQGTIEYKIGNHFNALDYYERAWNLIENKLDPWHTFFFNLSINIGNIHYVSGNYEKALTYYICLLDQKERLHPSSILDAYYYLAITYDQLQQDEKAEQYFRELISERIRYYGEENIALSYDYISYAMFLSKTGRGKESPDYLGKALNIRLKVLGAFHYLTAECYQNLGEYFFTVHNYDSALHHYQKALHSLDADYDPALIFNNPEPSRIVNPLIYIKILKGKAIVIDQLAKSETDSFAYRSASLDCYKLIFPAIDLLRNSSMSEEGRIFISENERDTYNNAVSLALSLYRRTGEEQYLESAFKMAERVKYSVLLMAVRDNEAISFSGVPDTILTALRGFREQVSSYMDLISDEEVSEYRDSVRLAGLYEELYSLKERETEFISELESEYPEYYRLKYDNRVAEPAAIMKRLGRNDRMMEYIISDSSLITFVLSKHDFFVLKQPIDSTFFRQMETARSFCIASSVSRKAKASFEEFNIAAAELHDLLIKPCSIRKGEQLIIIPDAAMNYLPFDILLDEKVEDDRDFKDFPFLIKENPLLYSYSSTLFLDQKSNQSGSRNKILAMAPGYENRDTEDTSSTVSRNINWADLRPLKASRDEITGIQSLVGGEAISGVEASEYLFKNSVHDYRILHLAMHALLDDEDPMYSKLIFANNNEGGEDGLLHVHEIYHLDLNASMVVLSACQTGSGILRMGEGIMSLARAFYYSGTPNVVMSLWTVGDISGKNLMINFYDHLLKGQSKTKAMQQAKLQYLNAADPDRQEPFYWSAYIVTGDPSPIYTRTKWLIYGIAALIISSGMFLVLTRWRRSSRRL